jgi:flagellar biosynthesis/type III secretory pathway chaperone
MSVSRMRTRRDLCRALQTLSEKQRTALTEQNYDELIILLGEKRTLLEQLAAYSSVATNWAAERVFLSPEDRAEGEALLNEANRLLADAAQREQHDVVELTQQRDATQTALNEIASSGRVHTAYRDALAPVTHRSLDVDR